MITKLSKIFSFSAYRESVIFGYLHFLNFDEKERNIKNEKIIER